MLDLKKMPEGDQAGFDIILYKENQFYYLSLFITLVSINILYLVKVKKMKSEYEITTKFKFNL